MQLEGDVVDGRFLSVTKADLADRQHGATGGYRSVQKVAVVDFFTGVPGGDRTG